MKRKGIDWVFCVIELINNAMPVPKEGATRYVIHVIYFLKKCEHLTYSSFSLSLGCVQFNSIQCFIFPYKEDIEQAIYNMYSVKSSHKSYTIKSINHANKVYG